MGIFELFMVGIGLSMDAFAVSVCKGLACRTVTLKEMITAGVWFGGFQALMPLVGYLLGSAFETYITSIDHWIAFILLGLIGLKMIREAFGAEEAGENDSSFGMKIMFIMAVATSIDALAVGLTFAFLQVAIVPAVIIIGVTTFVCSAAGVRIGNIFGSRYKKKAEIAGGIILILIGVKILVEHLLQM